MSKEYTCFDAIQVFKEHSFLKYLKNYSTVLNIYPTEGSYDTGRFYIGITDDENIKNCMFDVNAAKFTLEELDFDVALQHIKEKKYELFTSRAEKKTGDSKWQELK